MRILDIIEATTVDGPGFRTAVYFAGCSHNCPGCHNPQTHDFNGGYEITVSELAERLLATGLDVTLTGGDPVYQLDEAITLAEVLRSNGRNVWLYTGFLFEDIIADENKRRLAMAVDVVVDGPFILDQRDTSLQFRGSANQRIIDTHQSLSKNTITIWASSF